MPGIRRYQNPDLYEPLAAEYVLGTLKGGALKRFEQLLAERPYIQYSVDNWEKRFNSLGELQTEIKPSASVWKNIKAEIKADSRSQQPHQVGIAESGVKSGGLLARLGFWQAATAALSILLTAAIMMPGQVRTTINSAEPTFVAILESQADKPMMVTTGMRKEGIIKVRMGEMPDIPQSEDWVLWAIPKNGGAPVHVGALQRDTMQTDFKVSRQKWAEKFQDVEMFGVTSEPRATETTSHEDKPTTPIMYQGKCLEFT